MKENKARDFTMYPLERGNQKAQQYKRGLFAYPKDWKVKIEEESWRFEVSYAGYFPFEA